MNTPTLAGLSGILLLSLSAPLFAAEDRLTVVVTASRSAETVDQAMAPVTVITREQIEKTAAVTVSQVLSTVPGVVISRNGGIGQPTSLFLRGAESDQVLVLIDGVKVGSATVGTTPFQDLPLEQVEKIEVVRGPRSSLYGSEAIGGVIQIFTRKGSGAAKPTLSLGAGTHNTTDLSVGVSGGSDSGWYSLGASDFSSDGFNACRGSFDAGCFTIEDDDDGYENTSVSLRGGGEVNDRLSLEAAVLNSDSETEFDGSFQNMSQGLTRVSHIRANLAATQNWNSSLLVAQSKDELESSLDGVFASRFDTSRDQLSWQNDITLGSNLLILGVDQISDEVDSDTPFDVSSRDNTGIFASFNTGLGGGDMNVSLRSDDNEQFGTETTGGIAFGRDLSDGLRATVSYGTAFKAPTFNELYFPGFGNPDLVAETSNSIDLGLAGQNGNGRWSVNLFKTEINDLIGFDPVTFAPVNIDAAEITGLELASAYDLAGWALGASLTLQDPKDTGGGANDGNQLPRRAKQILQLSLDRQFSGWSVGASILNRGSSYDDLGNFTELDGYTVLDLRAGYRVHKNWKLGIAVNNALDEEYETAAFYNQDGVNAMATLRYIPK